jgi:undecaprenyl-diphosphatase
MAVIIVPPATVQAGCCWSAIDHKIPYDQSGIWNPNVYRTMIGVLGVADLGGALWEGAETRLGKTLWQTMDSQIIALGTTTVMKEVFTRVRPSDTDNPCEWFAGDHNSSFPSREAAWSASLVTPFVLEYGSQHPAAYGLLLFPLYIGAARVKAQAHWQSDVLFGWAVGGLSGWLAHSLETPLLVHVAPGGVVVGLKTRF